MGCGQQKFVERRRLRAVAMPRTIRVRQDASGTTAELAIAVASDEFIDGVSDHSRDDVNGTMSNANAEGRAQCAAASDSAYVWPSPRLIRKLHFPYQIGVVPVMTGSFSVLRVSALVNAYCDLTTALLLFYRIFHRIFYRIFYRTDLCCGGVLYRVG